MSPARWSERPPAAAAAAAQNALAGRNLIPGAILRQCRRVGPASAGVLMTSGAPTARQFNITV